MAELASDPSRILETDPAPGLSRRAVSVAVTGHAVEWYEFGVYGVMAAYVAAAIFPDDDPTMSLLLAWTAYSTAFLVRPIGGVVLAHIGDRVSRRRALFSTVTVMTGATFLMGLVPGYEVAGLTAPLLFLALRMAQGFAVGGEMPSATSYVVENVGARARERAASILAAGTFTASLFGSILATGLVVIVGEEAMMSWGWRVLFVVALPLGLVAILIRRQAPQDAVAGVAKPTSSPLRSALRTQRVPMSRYVCIALAYNVSLSVMLGGLLNELVLAGMPRGQAVAVNALAYAALVVSILVFGRLATRVGRRATLGIGLVGIAVVGAPAIALAATGVFIWAALGGMLLAIPIGVYATPVYLALAEMFPQAVRVTAGAIAFNLATAIASLVPAVTLGVRTAFGFPHGLLAWLSVAVVVAGAALLLTPRGAWSRHA